MRGAMGTEPHATTLRVPNAAEIDYGRLKAGRLARLQEALRLHELPVCLFYSPGNVRYATGVGLMSVWTQGAFFRYCLVPAEGAPILFEYPDAMHLAERAFEDVRPAKAWQFEGGPEAWTYARRWAAGLRSVLSELGFPDGPLGLDRLDAVGFLALQEAGIQVVDASAATVDAREVKTSEEVQLMLLNGAIGDAMLAEFEAAIRPGVREYELLAVLSDALLRRQGEGLFTRLVASGPNTNPWMSEAQDKLVMPGDLVGVDTDACGFEGYVIDVSRTFLCGEQPTPGQRDAYRAAHECVAGMVELIQPGLTFEEFVRRTPRLPERYRPQRYAVMAHQAGLDDEGPSIPYPEDVEERDAVIPERTLRENMVLCLECYAGEVGAPFGVKLEDQVLLTARGAERLCSYPYDATLLG
jgi:Xaa-Pro aminopeptidase